LSFNIIAQEVSISSELNIRNYYSYDIIGQINERILIYRDRGFTKEIDVFNQEMEHTQFAELSFEKKKVDVFGVVGNDTSFQILYGYTEKDSMLFRQRTYNQAVVMIDSSLLFKAPKNIFKRSINYVVSPDKSKILLSSMDNKDQFLFYLYDTEKQEFIWEEVFFIEGENIRKKYKDILLTDSGKFIIILQDYSASDKDIEFVAIDPFSSFQTILNLDFRERKKRDVFVEFDNRNNEFIVCGTYVEKKSKETSGFFLLKKKLHELQTTETPEFISFEESLLQDLMQGRRKKSKVLDDLKVRELILRNDGGVIIVSEVAREFSRRNPYNTATYPRDNFNPYTRRGWVDYYNDDIVVTSLSPEKTTDWYKVLYKKQFSQDDDAVFSSFFIMKTPSRLRFIYNDEIKRNNTVSEYLMDPVGKIARNSLLSTMHQEMRLRFKDALQISSNSMIVPSEKNYDLNLVKITY